MKDTYQRYKRPSQQHGTVWYPCFSEQEIIMDVFQLKDDTMLTEPFG